MTIINLIVCLGTVQAQNELELEAINLKAFPRHDISLFDDLSDVFNAPNDFNYTVDYPGGISKFQMELGNALSEIFKGEKIIRETIGWRSFNVIFSINENGEEINIKIKPSGASLLTEQIREYLASNFNWILPANIQSDYTINQLVILGETFDVIDEQPNPKGGMGRFYQYVLKNLKYPKEAKRHKVEGKVYVQFLVSNDGSLTDVVIARGLGYGCDEEAIRLVREAKPWIPGKKDGMPVPVRMILPITFKMD